MIDARKHYAPEKGADLIAAAVEAAGSYRELAERAGVTDSYLRQVRRGEKKISYGLQVVLENLCREAARREARRKAREAHA